MRFIGVDVGAKRVGIAVSDDEGRVAVPSESLDAKTAIVEILAMAPDTIAVGLPLDLKGREGPAARKARKFVDDLLSQVEAGLVPPQIEWIDERFSTVVASNLLRDAGLNAKKQKGVIDAMAASQILQTYLDSRKYE